MDGCGTYQELTERLARQDIDGAFDAATDTMIQLAREIQNKKDGPAAAALLPRLITEWRIHPDLESTSEDLKHLIAQHRVSGDGVQLFRTPTAAMDQPAYVAVKLLESGVVTAGQYIVILEELSRRMASADGTPVSVLHVLQERGVREVIPAALFMSRDSATPLVPLARFRPQQDALLRLPMEFATRRGAIAYNALDTELLVAVLNPYDMVLRSDVARATGGSCTFYLALPGEYDDTLSIVTEVSPLK